MNIWFVLWLLLSVALLYFTGWTFLILQKQKRAWRVFATKYKLRYDAGTIMASPAMSGVIGDYTVDVFVGEHQSDDARRARKLSAIEVKLNGKMPADGAIASADMVQIVRDQQFKNEVRPEHPDWDASYIAASDNKTVLESYLTQERLEALTGLMKIKHGAVIYIFRGDVALLRFDTPDPLDTPQKLDKIIKQMIEVARVLEFDDSKTLKGKA